MMFTKVLGLSIFTLATLITAQSEVYPAVIQWGSKGQYVVPGNDTIGNQLQLDTKEAKYLTNCYFTSCIIGYLSPDETEPRNVAVEGNKITAKSSNIRTKFIIQRSRFGKSYNIKIDDNKAEKQCWQVNDSTMLVEIAPCLSDISIKLYNKTLLIKVNDFQK
ncbi:unnamed protein product [Cunninghamella blakesleeana]